jgi:phospholipid transport system substrate-binding protein
MRRPGVKQWAAIALLAGLAGSAHAQVLASRSIGIGEGLPTAKSADAVDAAPDALLRGVTSELLAAMRQDPGLQISGRTAELVESTVLPLFDFRHMTQLAVARDWRYANQEQQDALLAEFRTLLIRTYSTALSNYRDQVIEYRPLRALPGQTDITVRSTVKQPGYGPITIDYDMEKTAAGWKVYDIKIAGISLITNYRSYFAQIVRDAGVDGLIRVLSNRNRLADPALRSDDSGRYFLFMYAVVPNFSRNGR